MGGSRIRTAGAPLRQHFPRPLTTSIQQASTTPGIDTVNDPFRFCGGSRIRTAGAPLRQHFPRPLTTSIQQASTTPGIDTVNDPLRFCGGRRIRTCEGLRQQIYSLPQLATLVSPQRIINKKTVPSLRIKNLPVDGTRASGRIRTDDRRFTKPLLYQLSYTGLFNTSNSLRASPAFFFTSLTAGRTLP